MSEEGLPADQQERRQTLCEEIGQIRDELFQLQKELGLEPELITLQLDTANPNQDYLDGIPSKQANTELQSRGPLDSFGQHPYSLNYQAAYGGAECGSDDLQLDHDLAISQITATDKKESSDFKNQVRFYEDTVHSRKTQEPAGIPLQHPYLALEGDQ